jgi:hypothetical protein
LEKMEQENEHRVEALQGKILMLHTRVIPWNMSLTF